MCLRGSRFGAAQGYPHLGGQYWLRTDLAEGVQQQLQSEHHLGQSPGGGGGGVGLPGIHRKGGEVLITGGGDGGCTV